MTLSASLAFVTLLLHFTHVHSINKLLVPAIPESSCAHLVSSSAWRESTTNRWTYRIKVSPWRIFGTIDVEIEGSNVEMEQVRSANFEMVEKGHFRLVLGPQPDGSRQEISMSGTGRPAGKPKIEGHCDEPVDRPTPRC